MLTDSHGDDWMVTVGCIGDDNDEKYLLLIDDDGHICRLCECSR